MFSQIIDLKNYYYISKIQKELEECNKQIKKLSNVLKVRKFLHLSVNKQEYLTEYKSIILKLKSLLSTVCQLEEYNTDCSEIPKIDNEYFELQKQILINSANNEIKSSVISIADNISYCLLSAESIYYILLRGEQKE